MKNFFIFYWQMKKTGLKLGVRFIDGETYLYGSDRHIHSLRLHTQRRSNTADSHNRLCWPSTSHQ